MLIPESKTEKEIAYLERFHKWIKTKSESDQALYCEHGKYVGFKAALTSFTCKECNNEG